MQEKTSIYFPEELSLKKLQSVQEIMRSKDAQSNSVESPNI